VQRINMSSGSGAPSGGVTGDIYLDYNTGELYTKHSGSWTVIPRLEDANAFTGANTFSVSQTFNGGWTGTTGSLSSTLHVNGNFDVATSKFTVAAATGNTLTAGTLDVTSTIIPHAHYLPNLNFTSDVGSLTDKIRSLYVGELQAETLVAQQVIATIGGRVVVAPTNLLTADLTNVATSITVKYNNLNNGDRIYMESAPGGTPQIEWMAVTSGAGGSAGAYTYSVTRDLDSSGANAWISGDAILDTGTTGSGHIDLYAASGILSGNGPTIAFNLRTGTTYNQISPRVVVGRLDPLYGYTSTSCNGGTAPCMGFAAGDPAAANVVIEGANGIRIRQSTTTYAQLSASVFTVGAPGGNNINFDGTNLLVTSGNVVIDTTGETLGKTSTTSAYDATSALKFKRATGAGFGQTGDINALYNISIGATLEELLLENTIIGNASANGRARTSVSAKGWDSSGGGSSTTEASVVLNSEVGANSITVTSSAINLNGTTTVTGALIGTSDITNTGVSFPYAFTGRKGTAGVASNNFNIWWDGSTFAHLYIDTVDLGTITIASDRRVKKNITPIGSALADVMKLQPVMFNWTNASAPTEKQYGVIAQDVAKVFPALVRNTGMKSHETPDGLLQVKYEELIPLLLRAIQEQQAQIDALKKAKK
jgi:hypothetical protein